jgi:hypothetical protein
MANNLENKARVSTLVLTGNVEGVVLDREGVKTMSEYNLCANPEAVVKLTTYDSEGKPSREILIDNEGRMVSYKPVI